jgi:DNA-binding HxlR family transcriptional regulator
MDGENVVQQRRAEKTARNGGLLTFWYKLMATLNKKVIQKQSSPPAVARMVEDIVGCKWSLTVLSLVTAGVNRPGAMQRKVEGLTAKVLNERLRKLLRFGIIDREIFAEVPPRVEYRLTSFGKRFSGLIEQIAALESER